MAYQISPIESSKRKKRRKFRRIHVEERRRGPQFLMVLLSVLGLALVAYRVFGPEVVRVEGVQVRDFDDGEVQPVVDEETNPRIEPAEFQAEIRALETALYDSASALDGDILDIGADVAVTAAGLEGKMKTAAGPRHLIVAQAAAEMTDRASAPDFSIAVLNEVRDQWMSIRRSEFQRAGWFRNPEEEIAFGFDDASNTVYRELASDLQRLIEDAFNEAEATAPEENPLETAPERSARIEQWRQFSSSWLRDIRQLRGELPPRPSAGAAQELLLAIQRLEAAFNQAERLASDRNLSQNPGFRDSFDRLLTELQLAEEAFNELILD